MTRLVEQIQRIARRVMEQDKPMEIQFGTVERLSPLEIRLSQKIVIGSPFLIQPVPELEQGDTVVLLRQRGGQQYFILAKR